MIRVLLASILLGLLVPLTPLPLSSGPMSVPTSTPEAELSSGPPFRGGLVIVNDITLPAGVEPAYDGMELEVGSIA